MPNLHDATTIRDNQFRISGGAPGEQVSWEVIARRYDAWVRDKGFLTEKDKPEQERGTYIYPEGFGKEKELQKVYQHIQQARGSVAPTVK